MRDEKDSRYEISNALIKHAYEILFIPHPLSFIPPPSSLSCIGRGLSSTILADECAGL